MGNFFFFSNKFKLIVDVKETSSGLQAALQFL